MSTGQLMMLAKTIAITLRKGGSGKTTTAVNLATALFLLGQRVLLVDLDPQANATLAVGIDPTTLPRTINHLFTDYTVTPRDTIVTTAFGLALLPSHPDLALTEGAMQATQVGMLKGLLEPLAADYAFIIIDTPPAESYLTVNALAAVDTVLIPLQAHYLALQGLTQALTQVEQVRHGLNPGLTIAGILPTLVNARTNISRTVLAEVHQNYPELVLPLGIEYSVKHSEASLAGLPIVLYDAAHQGARAYMDLARRFL
jgi:chromosome partitioning protein